MPRRILFRTGTFPYHVVSRGNNKAWFGLPPRELWDLFSIDLESGLETQGAVSHTIVLMSNHFHLLFTTPLLNLDDFMHQFLNKVCRSMKKATGRINHIFGGRYKWTLLGGAMPYAYAYKYCHRNPVSAGMLSRTEDYAYNAENRNCNFITPPDEALLKFVPRDGFARECWLNAPTTKQADEIVRLALRRTEFKFSKSSGQQKALRELRQVYGIEREDDCIDARHLSVPKGV